MKRIEVSRAARIAAFLAASTLVSCDDDERVAPAPPSTLFSLSSDAASLESDLDGVMTLRLSGESVLTLPRAAFTLGIVGALDDGRAYDPRAVYGDDPLGKAPADLVWREPTSITVVASSDDAVELALDYGGGLTGGVNIRASGPRRFSLAWTASGAPVAYHRFGATIDETEGLYGLGEQLDHVDQRGQRREMQLEIDPRTESANNEAHVPVPLLLGTTGWGLYVESELVGVVDAAKSAPDRVEAVFRSDPAGTAPFVVDLFAEAEPLDLVGHFWQITGAPTTPAPWVLGPLFWRDENVDQAEVLRDLEALRELDVAATGFWIDRPYATGVQTFDFAADRFADPVALMRRATALGYRGGLWHVPYLDEDDPNTQALRDEAEAQGLYPPKTSILLNGWGKPLDFTNPAAIAFWQRQLEPYRQLGVAGYKLDYAEDIVPSIADARSVWSFFDGSDERTEHARYNRRYHEVYAAMIPDGGLLLCRHANPGEQSLGIVVWPGDLDATFARSGDPAVDDGEDYVSVGGLPASVVAGLTLSASGFPFYGADTGGYRHAPPDPELWIRWIEQTALSTVMQVGNGASTVPWEGEQTAPDGTSVLDVLRTYARLHLRLVPYLEVVAARMPVEGRPIQRPLGLAYPALGVHPDDVYLLGPDLLVAPVVDRDVRDRDVPIPPGVWVDWWTGARVEGPAVVHVDAPLGRLPLFLRAGAMLPLLAPDIDTVEPASDPRVVSRASGRPERWWRGAPGATSSGTSVDGGRVDVVATSGGFDVSLTPGTTGGEGTGVELWVGSGPASFTVSADGVPLPASTVAALVDGGIGWSFDPAGLLWIRVPTNTQQVRVRR